MIENKDRPGFRNLCSYAAEQIIQRVKRPAVLIGTGALILLSGVAYADITRAEVRSQVA